MVVNKPSKKHLKVQTAKLKSSINFFQNHFTISVFLFSAIALFFSFSAEFIWHLQPCKICKLERMSHVLIFTFSALSFLQPVDKLSKKILPFTLLASTAISFYHLMIVYGIMSDPCTVPTTITSIEQFSRLLDAPPPCSIAKLKLCNIPISAYNCLTLAILFCLKLIKRISNEMV